MGKWVPVEERLPEVSGWDSGFSVTWYVTRRDGTVNQDCDKFDIDVIAWYEEDPPAPYIPPLKPKPGPMSLSEAVAEAERCGLDYVWLDGINRVLKYKIDASAVSLTRVSINRWYVVEP